MYNIQLCDLSLALKSPNWNHDTAILLFHNKGTSSVQNRLFNKRVLFYVHNHEMMSAADNIIIIMYITLDRFHVRQTLIELTHSVTSKLI